MTKNTAVVDASLALKWVLNEELSREARALAGQWRDAGVSVVAPHFLMAEAANTLHRWVLRGALLRREAFALLESLIEGDIGFLWVPGLSQRALSIAAQFNQGAVYDAHYLALAEALDCEMWTADARFFRAMRGEFEQVRLLGEE
ncbi:MAG: type II toxin-antitoxin system VapC family toxin [Dehalococcoidia bacterium]